MSQPQEPSALLPLTPAVLHILLTLSDGERHGYAIMVEVKAQTDGAVRMGPGTLYGSLKRMISSDLVEEADSRDDPTDVQDERRRYYRLTDFGWRVLEAELKRLAHVVQMPTSRRILGPIRTEP